MKNYSNPKLEVVMFNREEILLTSVIPQEGDYSANLLNEYFFGTRPISAATTVQLQKISDVAGFKR